jgi:formate-dependent nitrite reductase membrane component NrfD
MALEDTLFPLLFWDSPIGLGIFFAGLGYLIKCAAVAARKERNSKETKG